MGENTTRPDRTSSPIPVLERWASDPGAARPYVMRSIRPSPGVRSRRRNAAESPEKLASQSTGSKYSDHSRGCPPERASSKIHTTGKPSGNSDGTAPGRIRASRTQICSFPRLWARRAEISAVRQRLGVYPGKFGEGAPQDGAEILGERCARAGIHHGQCRLRTLVQQCLATEELFEGGDAGQVAPFPCMRFPVGRIPEVTPVRPAEESLEHRLTRYRAVMSMRIQQRVPASTLERRRNCRENIHVGDRQGRIDDGPAKAAGLHGRHRVQTLYGRPKSLGLP